MIKTLSLAVFLILWTTHASAQQSYKTISYLKIKVDSLGNLPTNPYIINLENKRKRLVVIGTQHTRDTSSPVFIEIEKAFKNWQPGVVINEGGNLTRTYTSRNEAIKKSGELGLVKYLADKAGIKTVNGDAPDKLEFDELTLAYSKEEALLFFASERFIFPYVFGQFSGPLAHTYDSIFIKKYLEKEGIELAPHEKTFAYYKQLYQKYFSEEFSLDNINQLHFIPFSTTHHLNDIARKSKELRDVYLCQQIETQLRKHDRVLVVYGGWHVLAIEPALTQIINRSNQMETHKIALPQARL